MRKRNGRREMQLDIEARGSRKQAKLLPMAVIALCVGLGLASSGRAQTFRTLDYSGAELFQRFCAACHGAEGKGNGPVAATLNVMVPNLTRLSDRNGGRFPAQRVEEYIDGRSPIAAHGSRTMPVWGYEFWVEEGGDITAERNVRKLIGRLVRYLESIQAMPRRGEEPR